MKSGAEGLVNPVNCQGVAGRGLALQFKERFPANDAYYRFACYLSYLQPGGVAPFCDAGTWIFNLATKNHWRKPSQLRWLRRGALQLARACDEKRIRTLALPRVGCGLGGLPWPRVRPLMVESFAPLEDCVVYVFDEGF